MPVRNGLFSSQSASASHFGQRTDRILVNSQVAAPAPSFRTAQALPRQCGLALAGNFRRAGLPRQTGYPVMAAA